MIDPYIYTNYMNAIQDGYQDVQYHNKTHGIDVCQTVYYFSITCGLMKIA